MNHLIRDVETLESVVGRQPLAAIMKSIGELDDHCSSILEHATAAVMAYLDHEGVMRIGVIGGEAGFARPEGAAHLAFSAPTGRAAVGAAAALLFFTPGWRESLRVNGRIEDTGVAVEEAFVHCGKAMIRSALWSSPDHRTNSPGIETPVGEVVDDEDVVSESDRIDDAQRAFLSTAPFAVIGSCDGDGRADASPKGDPPGFLRVLDDHTIAIPDRPGNRRTDTFHNLLERPAVTLLAMTPGDNRVVEIRGRARLSADPVLLATMVVKDQVPKIAVVIDVDLSALRVSDAVKNAALWNPETHIPGGTLPRAAKIWSDHVKSSDRQGLTARAVRTGVSEAALRAGIAVDYRQNLY